MRGATFCSFAFAKVCTLNPSPRAICPAPRVLPFYEALGVPPDTVLTDKGREFCGEPEQHPYELLSRSRASENRTTKVRSPRTNGASA